MHEMALAENIIDIVVAAARREGFVQVQRVGVSIGSLAVVLPDALQTAFRAAAIDTLAADAELALTVVPGTAWCAQCRMEVTIMDSLDACPRCQGYALRITAGSEMRVTDIDGED